LSKANRKKRTCKICGAPSYGFRCFSCHVRRAGSRVSQMLQSRKQLKRRMGIEDVWDYQIHDKSESDYMPRQRD